MSWLQIVMLVLSVLRSLKKSDSAEAFCASAGGQKLESYGLDGEWLKKIWENREEIIAFVLKLIELFSDDDDGPEVFASAVGIGEDQ